MEEEDERAEVDIGRSETDTDRLSLAIQLWTHRGGTCLKEGLHTVAHGGYHERCWQSHQCADSYKDVPISTQRILTRTSAWQLSTQPWTDATVVLVIVAKDPCSHTSDTIFIRVH